MRNLIDRFIISRFERDEGQKLLAQLRSLSIQGRAEARAAMRVTAASLLAFEESNGEELFAKALGHLLKAETPANDQDKAALSKYCLSLADRQRNARTRNTLLAHLIATGIPVWIASIRAMLQPALVPLAIDVWEIVDGGDEVMAQRSITSVLESLNSDTELAESIRRMRSKPLTPAFVGSSASDASDLVMANGDLRVQ
jgi:hypothetical protein